MRFRSGSKKAAKEEGKEKTNQLRESKNPENHFSNISKMLRNFCFRADFSMQRFSCTQYNAIY